MFWHHAKIQFEKCFFLKKSQIKMQIFGYVINLTWCFWFQDMWQVVFYGEELKNMTRNTLRTQNFPSKTPKNHFHQNLRKLWRPFPAKVREIWLKIFLVFYWHNTNQHIKKLANLVTFTFRSGHSLEKLALKVRYHSTTYPYYTRGWCWAPPPTKFT